MKEKDRQKLLLGLLAVVAVVAAIVLSQNRPAAKPPPDRGLFYYTGPMKSKGNPNLYGTDDGRRVPPPAGAKTAGTSPAAPTD